MVGKVSRDAIFSDLNDEQRRAPAGGGAPVCILAGAGSGKTTTIMRRIAWQVESGTFRSGEILAVTFTDKAAGEMRSRLPGLGVRGGAGPPFPRAPPAPPRPPPFQGGGGGERPGPSLFLLRGPPQRPPTRRSPPISWSAS